MKQCAVETCEGPIKARGWCWKHYLRWHRHGDPEYVPMRHNVCVVGDCAAALPEPRAKGLCEKHRTRVRRHGDPNVVLERRRPLVTYQGAHDRVRSDRGSAKGHTCVDCGNAAQQWSYNHQDMAHLVSPQGFPYSLDPAFYEPRCVSCHVTLDQRDRYTDRVFERRRAAGG